MRPLRICLVIPTLDLGGAEKQLCMLACGLDRSRFDPHVVCLTRGGPREASLTSANVPYTVLNKRMKFDPWAYLRLTRLFRELRPDVVHTWIFAANSYGRLAAIRHNIPVVLGGERCIDSWKRGYEFWIDRYLSRRSQGIITNSRGVVDFYARHGIDPNKFFVIPNGVDPIVEKGISREEACKRLGIPKDRRIIAVIGRLWHQKNHKDIFWAIELLRVARNDLALVVIGDGPLRKRLELYRDQLRAADTIRLVGERSDVHDLLPHFEVVINSSFEEGQSNVIMEAMANGIPVVASDIPGNRDLVLHGNTGFLFPLGATHELAKLVHRLLEEEGLRQTFGDAAKQRIAELFSHDQMVRAHEELYLRLSNGS